MKQELWSRLLRISSLGLAAATMIFVLLAVFEKAERGWMIPAGLCLVLLSGLFQVVLMALLRKN